MHPRTVESRCNVKLHVISDPHKQHLLNTKVGSYFCPHSGRACGKQSCHCCSDHLRRFRRSLDGSHCNVAIIWRFNCTNVALFDPREQQFFPPFFGLVSRRRRRFLFFSAETGDAKKEFLFFVCESFFAVVGENTNFPH